MSSPTGLAAAAVCFGRDQEENLHHVAALAHGARAQRVSLLALPKGCLGGHASLGSVRDGIDPDGPTAPTVDVDGPELRRVAEIAREMTLVVGFGESDGSERFTSCAAVTGDGVLAVHRKVHQCAGEHLSYRAGGELSSFDSPVGRMGMLICYDKAFPESARTLALDGAGIVACVSAWPASREAGAGSVEDDPWTHRFNLFDQVRALENQIVWLSANQSETVGALRFVANAKVVGPGDEILDGTGLTEGLAVASVDVDAVLCSARGAMHHLRDRRPDLYVSREDVHA